MKKQNFIRMFLSIVIPTICISLHSDPGIIINMHHYSQPNQITAKQPQNLNLQQPTQRNQSNIPTLGQITSGTIGFLGGNIIAAIGIPLISIVTIAPIVAFTGKTRQDQIEPYANISLALINLLISRKATTNSSLRNGFTYGQLHTATTLAASIRNQTIQKHISTSPTIHIPVHILAGILLSIAPSNHKTTSIISEALFLLPIIMQANLSKSSTPGQNFSTIQFEDDENDEDENDEDMRKDEDENDEDENDENENNENFYF